MASSVAVVADAAAIFGGFMLATWIRFDSGLVPMLGHLRPDRLYAHYSASAGIVTVIFLLIFQGRRLYVRPQIGSFANVIPKTTRCVGVGIVLSTAMAFAIRIDPPVSRIVMGLSFVTISATVLFVRLLLFRFELHLARHRAASNRVLILGADSVAARLRAALQREPRLRSEVVGFLRTNDEPPDPAVPAEMILGDMSILPTSIERHDADQVILCDSGLDRQRMAELVLFAERNMITFNLVPDLFRLLLGSVDVRTIDDIPLLGVCRLPLDYFWNRVLKRAEDIVGAVVGLVLCAPVMLVAAVLIRRSSAGPVFFRQERCGQDGQPFVMYKLRTMTVDAEEATGPVWAVADDPRRTGIGAFLRRFNLDELPQFWNVLTGSMSLVGPRPERPVFVDQFKEEIGRYMSRHVSKPGMTGWAQVNGLRGNTDLEERIKYDLYYLENWSLALDFKILVRTLYARTNAY